MTCTLLRFRALIIRAGEIIPMSSSFTPESERQRIQFLVREIWISHKILILVYSVSCVLFSSWPWRMFFPHSDVCLHSFKNKIPDYGACLRFYTGRLHCFSFCFVLSQAHLQPSLLGNEFTHLEFPRRVTKKEVGKRMLYRDFTMNGW